MSRPETKGRPAKCFSVLIVPRNSSNVRRFECSSRSVHLAVGVAASLAVIFVATLASFVYYRHVCIMTEDVRAQAADFVREKETLLARQAQLETAVGRTERFAAKLESAVGGNGEALAGKGPVDEEDWLPGRDPRATTGNSMNLGGSVWKSPFSKSLSAGLNLAISNLEERSDAAEERIHSVFALHQDKLFFWASLPSLWPSRGWVTSEFGVRRGWGGHGRLHEGIDIAGPVGTPIVAPGDGLITSANYYHGYGQRITIDHGNGISTLYGHCSSMYVHEGQRVKRGMIIAAVGNTGSSTGPHLHYEVHVDGVPVNPKLYVMQ
ncbi:MAG: M23 family metallopeptidase [Pseudomonadota bacterium]